METVSYFSLAACLAYVMTAAVSLMAAFAAHARRHRAAARHWIFVGMIFVALAGWRLANGEVLVQAHARDWAQTHGWYDERHDWQAPITLAALLAVGAVLFAAFRWAGTRPSARALCVAVVMILFAALRVISLHAVDEVLYRAVGPFHLNYVIDLGLTGVAAALALVDCGWFGAFAAPGPRRAPHRRRSGSRDHRPRP